MKKTRTKPRTTINLLFVMTCSEIKNKYKWKEQISLKKGLLETVKWIEKNLSYFKKNNLEYKHFK